jgi:hypothetical protein
LNDFCEKENIRPVTRHQCNMMQYNVAMKTFTVIDHFILSSHLYDNSVLSANVIHDVDNTSDHDPLYLELDISVAFADRKELRTCILFRHSR